MEKLTVIKVGGKIVEDAASLDRLLDDFSHIPGYKVLVHGGGRSATKIAASLGIETTMVGGRRITDAEMLKVVTMVYGGLVNKNIVAKLQARYVNALGLTGADLDTMLSQRRKPVLVKADVAGTTEDVLVDYGFVGDVYRCNAPMLSLLLQKNVVPVMAPLTHDGEGNMLNTNADTIASEVAKALAPFFDVTLVYCFEKSGVLLDENDEDSVIPYINAVSFRKYVEDGVIKGGMIPKIENALTACASGVSKVVITKAEHLGQDKGTVVGIWSSKDEC